MSIHKKMLKFHAEFNGVKKTGFNPHFKSQHFTLDEIVHVTTPILNKLGLYVCHGIVVENEKPIMQTTITDSETETWIMSSFPMTLDSNPQKMASQVTYYKRYNLCGLMNIAEQDDDGNAAAEPVELATPDQWKKINKYRKDGKMTQATAEWLDQRISTLSFDRAAELLTKLAKS